ncbi:uncharacterized protein FIESC28_00138 [Fusarium coffeatum]|uniref:Uncharacterized protein n=1 Tax=Fusarium coffeatum TaxID=231269 RepID=A0A366SEH8_9HYPO|nr:uncharacterized protein FIESC28_00138 [Fusarium coffeatum]RBR27066.1 hypothetical protein FIESC28_00138 [Fusarium coffeatum]
MSQDEVVITALHRDLRHKYEKHFQTIEKVWLLANQAKRQQLFQGCTHPLYEPEQDWNVADITEDKDLFLRMLTWRATATLENQFHWGLDWARGGDINVADRYQLEQWTRYPNYHEGTYIYIQEDLYGETFDVKPTLMDDRTGRGYSPKLTGLVRRWNLMPYRLVSVVLRRQVNIIYCLNALVDKVLDTEKAQCLEKSARYAEEDRTPTLDGLIASAGGYKTHYQTCLYRFHNDTRFLSKCVRDQLDSRPERTCHLEGLDQEHLAGSIGRDIFDATYTKVRSLAFWRSVHELLVLAYSTGDNRRFLQEIFQLCEQQCEIVKQNVKRHIAMGIAKGRCYYSAIHGRFFDTYRGEWILKDIHIHYLMDLVTRVWGPDMTICQLRKLDEFYKEKPDEHSRLSERESEALYELCTILAFFQDFKKIFPRAEDFSDFKMTDNLLFERGLRLLDRDIERLRRNRFPHICDINITDLEDPFTAKHALDELRVYVKRHLGTGLGNLYRDQVFDMLDAVQTPELIRIPDLLEPDFGKRLRSRQVREARRLLLPCNEIVAEPSTDLGRMITGGRTRIVRSEIAATLLELFDKDSTNVSKDMDQVYF